MSNNNQTYNNSFLGGNTYFVSTPEKFNVKNSASTTNVARAKICVDEKEKDVIIKYHSLNDHAIHLKNESDSLHYEAKVYKYIRDNIIHKNVCPNFVNYVGFDYIKYSDAMKKLDMSGLIVCDKVGVLITEAIVSCGDDTVCTLSEWYEQKQEQQDTNKVIFQLIYALAVLENFKIAHNDLHGDNVFIKKITNGIDLCYSVKKGETVKTFKFNTRYIVYIYDWDRSYIKELGRNYMIDDDWYTCSNLLNLFRPKNDLLSVIVPFLDTIKRHIDETVPVGFYELSNVQSRNILLYKIINKKIDDNVFFLTRAMANNILGCVFVDTFFPNLESGIFTINNNKIGLRNYEEKNYWYISNKTSTPQDILFSETFDEFLTETKESDCYFCECNESKEEQSVKLTISNDYVVYDCKLISEKFVTHYETLFDWLYTVCNKFQLTNNVFINTAYLYNHYVKWYGAIKSDELQRVGVSCLYYVYSLYGQSDSLSATNFKYITNNSVSCEQIMETIEKIKLINFELFYTPFDFIYFNTKDDKLIKLAVYIVLCSVQKYDMQLYSPDVIAQHSMDVAISYINKSVRPDDDLSKFLDNNVKNIKECDYNDVYFYNKTLHGLYF